MNTRRPSVEARSRFRWPVHQFPVATAVDEVFDEIEEMGWTRETKYDEEFVARKHKALREAGWTVITTGTPGSGELLSQLESPEALDVSDEL